jgi:hypothetical protein
MRCTATRSLRLGCLTRRKRKVSPLAVMVGLSRETLRAFDQTIGVWLHGSLAGENIRGYKAVECIMAYICCATI